MVSAVENMAANSSWSAFGKATDLRHRILFTLGLLSGGLWAAVAATRRVVTLFVGSLRTV